MLVRRARGRARGGRPLAAHVPPSPAAHAALTLNLTLTPARGAQVSLKRERLELSPVYATAVAHGGHTLGYIRLVNFGAHAAADMEKAMDRLEARAPKDYSI
jgi:hypothetical protein